MVSLKPQHIFWNQAWFQKPFRCFCWFQYGFSETILVSKRVFGPNMAKNEVSVKLGQLFEFQGSYLKLGWNCNQFHLSLLKFAYHMRKIEHFAKKCCKKSMVFCQKNNRKSTSFKKVNFEQYFSAIFLFLSRFQDFWKRKICFFASKKITTL